MIMPSRPRVIFVIFFLTAVLVFIIHIRTASSRIFNRYCKAQARQKILRQELRDCQLHFDSLTTPYHLMQNITTPADSESSNKRNRTQ